jgi:AraC family transcriptional regulator, regulatory protein of adaptative response / methylated-DNA-[protein]-cysteine methyltransferase
MIQQLPNPEILYNALLNKDSSFEGIFIVGVKSTGIFCRPVCTAKKPKRENVEFFSTIREALMHGYRPCKICNPLGYLGETPKWLKQIMEEINETPGIRLKDEDIKQRGVDPNRIRRWFLKHHGITFQAYLRILRVGQAFGRIQYGDKVINAAFGSGYESLSGFTESFKKITGFPPRKSSQHQIITITRILTPLGPMLAGATSDGICLLEFIDRRMLETQLRKLKKIFNAEIVPGAHQHFNTLNTQIQEYFAGTRKKFDLPLIVPGTEFQKQVWKALQQIPYGHTRTYKEQAIALGNAKSVRAVARANGENRIAIIIPCHRVIGKKGTLVGYGGGLWRKQYLLNLERFSA